MGDLLGSIYDFLGGTVVAALESFVVWLYQLVVIVFQVLYQLLLQLGQWLLDVFRAVAGFFKNLWESFFKGIFLHVWDAIKTAWKWIELRLRPIINFLKKIRDWYLQWYRAYIRPILQLLQQIRRYLQILSWLHISIAQKLDAYLAQLQAKIVQSFATVTATLNTAIDLLNALVDPNYLIRHPQLLLSIRRNIPALIHAVTGRPPGYWFPSPKGAAGGPFSPPSFPFNFADPAQNPATSTYLGDDGIGGIGGGFLDGFAFTNSSVDQVAVLDYFNDDLYPEPACQNPALCLAAALTQATAEGT